MKGVIKWWNNKDVLTIIGLAWGTVLAVFLLVYYIPYGWIPSIILTFLSGKTIRKKAIKALNKLVDTK